MLGKEIKEYGPVFNSDDLMVVHLHLEAGQKIQPHDHPGQEIFFTVVDGEVEVYLNEEETHVLQPKKVLNFKGEARISATALKESDVFVYLINRRK